MAKYRIEEIRLWLKVESEFIKEEYKENEIEINPIFFNYFKTILYKKYFLSKNTNVNGKTKFKVLYPSQFFQFKTANIVNIDKIKFGLFKGEFYIKFSDSFYLFKSKSIDIGDEVFTHYIYYDKRTADKKYYRTNGVKSLDVFYEKEFLNYLNNVGFHNVKN